MSYQQPLPANPSGNNGGNYGGNKDPSASQDDFTPLIISSALDKIRDEMNNKFVKVAKNMEKQLNDLKAALEKEKQRNNELRQKLQNTKDQVDEFKQENSEKINDLNQINSMYNNDVDDKAFTDLVNEVIERHQAFAQQLQTANYSKNVSSMNKAWQDEIYKITQNIKSSANPTEQLALIDELENRTRELETIKKIMNGDAPLSVLEDLADQCEERHAAQTGDAMSTYKSPGIINDQNALRDNSEWEKLLRDFVSNPPQGQGVKPLNDRNDLYLKELADRIDDLKKIKDLYDAKQNDNISDDDIKDQADNLLNNLKQRHNDIEDRYADTIDKNDNNDIKKLNDFKDNDTIWRNQLGKVIEQMLGDDEPDEMWWLDLDPQRKSDYDAVISDPHDYKILLKDAVYLNRELLPDGVNVNDDDIKDPDNPYTELYIPIDPISKHRIYGTCYDASEVCDFLHKVNPDMIDKRVIHRPANIDDPYPLTNKQVQENVNLLLSSCKAMALQLPSYQSQTWLNPKLHSSLLVRVLHALAKERLKNYVSIEKHPEIIRLLTSAELNDDPEKIRNLLSADEVLKRWINMSLGRNMNTNIGNYGADLYNTLRKIDNNFANKSPQLNNNILNKAAADCLLNYVKNNLNIKTNMQSDDLLKGNPKLEELLAAKIFDLNNGLANLNNDEINKYRAFWTDDNPNDDAYLPWLNSQLPPHMQIGNLYRDLSDGIILAHILEKSNPGSINWKKLRKQIRHKFDKISNCNYVYSTMKKKFPFKLVGIAGPDIVDGTQKYIHTILWQIMRYQATKQLSALAFGGKSVSDDDILKWSQDTHNKLGNNKKTKTVKSFRDRTLTTCVFYLELLRVISDPNFINDKFVDYNVVPLTSSSDNFMKERMDNARYCISLIRRYGGDIFILPEDLVIMEPKAVLSIFAAIMTIDFENKKTIKNPNNNNNQMNDIQQAEQALYNGGSGFSG